MRDVKKTYSDFTLDVKELSLDQGYIMGLVGQNGAGKSTTIKILMNLIYPDEGRVEVLGMEQPKEQMHIKRLVGYVSEEPRFYDEMTVAWMAGLVGHHYPTWDPALYENYLEKFELNPRKKVKELSKGMRVKLGLLLALAHRPRLLILDEPTSGIDPIVRNQLLREISEMIRHDERTVLFSSHITQDVEQVADYIAIIHEGRIVEYSDKESLMDRWKMVTGMIPSHGDLQEPQIRSMFKRLEIDRGAFAGLTDCFSLDWMRSLENMGIKGPKIQRVNLDDIIISLAAKEE